MNKNIFCLITIIVIILLIDLVFNISKPLFRESEGFDNHTSMKSLVNILDGTTVSIEKIGETNSYYIPIFDEEDRVLGLDKYNELVISDKIPENAWTLINFDGNDETLNNIITDFKNNGVIPGDVDLTNEKYKLLTKRNYAIQYTRNSLIATPLPIAVTNHYYNFNLWMLNDSPGPTNELVLRDIKQSYLGPVKYPSGGGDPDKINIKLNIEDEKLQKLLNLNGESVATNAESKHEQCDTWLSKDAVKSLCPGCV